MRHIFLLLAFVLCTAAFAQHKEKTISISCYVNPELYLQAGVIAQVSDKAGNVSCNGKYLFIHNKSANAFYYKNSNSWVPVKPHAKSIIPIAGNGSSSSNAVYRLDVKYRPDVSGSISAKLTYITDMNAKTDRVKAAEAAGLSQPEQAVAKTKEVQEKSAKATSAEKPAQTRPAAARTASTAKSTGSRTSGKAAGVSSAGRAGSASASRTSASSSKSRPAASSARPSSASGQSRQAKASAAPANALGLRIDAGDGGIGLGPNFKHRFNRKTAIDAALVFHEGDVIGFGAQLEQLFPVRNEPGLNFYIGVGPNLLFWKKETGFALVPVGGVEYAIPRTPLNFSVDWRPNFFLSPDADVQAGRFGLSLRVAF